jgi:hypothetical protein
VTTSDDISPAALFDQLCVRWAREAELILMEAGSVTPTLVLLPRDPAAEEVAVRLDGLRGNLAERGPQLVSEIRPSAEPHDPAGLVFLAEMRLGTTAGAPGADGVAVYVSLGSPAFRRALGYDLVRAPVGPATLRRRDADPDVAMFSWLDALLRPLAPPT